MIVFGIAANSLKRWRAFAVISIVLGITGYWQQRFSRRETVSAWDWVAWSRVAAYTLPFWLITAGVLLVKSTLPQCRHNNNSFTRHLNSIALLVIFGNYLECFMLGAGWFGHWAASLQIYVTKAEQEGLYIKKRPKYVWEKTMRVILIMFFLVFCSIPSNVTAQNTTGNRNAKCGEVVLSAINLILCGKRLTLVCQSLLWRCEKKTSTFVCAI